MTSYNKTIKILTTGIFLYLLSIFAFPIGCTVVVGTIGVVAAGARKTLEFRTPESVIRIIDDNPVYVSVSPYGQYMYRRYSYDTESMGVVENLTTGEIQTLSETATYNLSYSRANWLNDSLFIGRDLKCIYNIDQPDICAMPILHQDVDGNNYSLNFLLENSRQIITSQKDFRIYGFGQNTESMPVAYLFKGDCFEDCRTGLEQTELVTDVTVHSFSYARSISPDGQYRANHNLECVNIVDVHNPKRQTKVCLNEFWPSERLELLGWNVASDGYYFHVHFDSDHLVGGGKGDVFLLSIP